MYKFNNKLIDTFFLPEESSEDLNIALKCSFIWLKIRVNSKLNNYHN